MDRLLAYHQATYLPRHCLKKEEKLKFIYSHKATLKIQDVVIQ